MSDNPWKEVRSRRRAKDLSAPQKAEPSAHGHPATYSSKQGQRVVEACTDRHQGRLFGKTVPLRSTSKAIQRPSQLDRKLQRALASTWPTARLPIRTDVIIQQKASTPCSSRQVLGKRWMRSISVTPTCSLISQNIERPAILVKSAIMHVCAGVTSCRVSRKK